MPEELRDGLLDRLAACFEPDAIKTLDTASFSGEHVFEALHFSWYNRHCTEVRISLLWQKLKPLCWHVQGHGAPLDTPPMTLKRTAGIKTNYHQFIPYPSKDMIGAGKKSIYQSVKNILGPVFDWLEGKVTY